MFSSFTFFAQKKETPPSLDVENPAPLIRGWDAIFTEEYPEIDGWVQNEKNFEQRQKFLASHFLNKKGLALLYNRDIPDNHVILQKRR